MEEFNKIFLNLLAIAYFMRAFYFINFVHFPLYFLSPTTIIENKEQNNSVGTLVFGKGRHIPPNLKINILSEEIIFENIFSNAEQALFFKKLEMVNFYFSKFESNYFNKSPPSS